MDTEVCYELTVPLFSVTEGWTGFVDALEDCCEKGIVFKGDTAEDLAWAMGVKRCWLTPSAITTPAARRGWTRSWARTPVTANRAIV